jgi:hypothetical protein
MITKTSMRQKASVLALLFLTAFLVPIGVRAATPPPLTTVVNVSPIGYGTGGCSGTSGTPITVISDNFTIPSSHSAYILPPVFTGLFSSTSQTNPFFLVTWFVNSTQLGSMNTYTQSNGGVTEESFGQQILSSSALSFFNTAHAGRVSYDFIVDISTVSGQQVCVQLPYLSLVIVET